MFELERTSFSLENYFMEMSEQEMMMCGLVDSTYLVGGGDGRCLPSERI
jgi:hypothetical protein